MTASAQRPQAELVERYHSTGDNRYFEALYRQARRRVYGVSLRLMKDPARAEDLTHEAFLRAYRQFETLDGDNFAAWVERIARNLALNRLRDEMNRQRLLRENPPVTVNQETPEERAGNHQNVEKAERILAELAPHQRKVLLMKYVEGYTYREIAELTRYPQQKIRSYLQNGRRRFRILWEQLEAGT